MMIACVSTVFLISMIILQHACATDCTGDRDDFIPSFTPSRNKGKSPKSFRDHRLERAADDSQSSRKGKEKLTHGSTPHGEGTSAAPISTERGAKEGKKLRRPSNCMWPNKMKDHVLYLYFNQQEGGVKDFQCIQNYVKHESGHYLQEAYLRKYIARMINLIVYDKPHPKEKRNQNNPRMDYLRIYYQTRGGDESKHEIKMLQQWLREHPRHEDTPVPNMKIYVENMIRKIMKVSLEQTEEETVRVNKRRMVDWKPEHDLYLHELMMKLPKGSDKEPMIYRKMCERFSDLESLSARRVYRRAVHVAYKVKISKLRGADSHEHREEQEKSVPFFHFLDDQSYPPWPHQSSHYGPGEVGSSSSHTGEHSDELNLTLGLNTFDSKKLHEDHDRNN